MITQQPHRTAFVGGPFKAVVDPATGMMRASDRHRYEALISHLER